MSSAKLPKQAAFSQPGSTTKQKSSAHGRQIPPGNTTRSHPSTPAVVSNNSNLASASGRSAVLGKSGAGAGAVRSAVPLSTKPANVPREPNPVQPSPALAPKDLTLRTKTTSSTTHGGSLGITFEAHFLLQKPGQSQQSPASLVNDVVVDYNKMFHKQVKIPKMSTSSAASENSWVLHHISNSSRVKLVSPVLHAPPSQRDWSASLRAIWQFFILHWRVKKGPYSLSVDTHCRTHLRIAVPDGCLLQQLKHLAQAAARFESVLKALMPLDYVGTEKAVRNRTGTRPLAAIEACKTEEEVVKLMNPKGATYLGFNFLKLKSKAIEFCPGAACRTMNDFFTCASVAMSFVRASKTLQTTTDLERFPPTISGFNDFIKRGVITGSDGPYLGMLLADYASHKTPKPMMKKVAGVGAAEAGKFDTAEQSTGNEVVASRIQLADAWKAGK